MAAFGFGDASGERLAVGPDRAVLKILFLPDRHSAFECIDDPAASIEGGRAVRRGYDDQDAGLTDFQPAQTMHYGEIADGKLPQRLLGERVHLLDSHLFIGFIIQVQSAPRPGVVANNAFKYDDGSV